MDTELRQHLTDMTKAFYRYHGDSFSRTRRSGWDSWHHLLSLIPSHTTSVIDYGCGNGRFADFLADSDVGCSYLGVDSDPALLEIAADTGRQLMLADYPAQVEQSAELVVCFGVTHHIPGREQRVAFVRTLAKLVKPDGLLAVSFWQPERLANFASKVCTNHGISGLEKGDHLLGWQGDFSQLRYCHHFSDSEIDLLVSESELGQVERFLGTGNDLSNAYVILRP